MAKYSVSYIYEIVDKYSAVANKIKRSTDSLKDSMDRAAQKAAEFGKKMAKVGTVMAATVSTPILMLGNSMLKAASDAEETRSKYATIFKELGQGAQDTADSFAKSFGLAGTTARQLLGDTGDMLSGFGFTAEAALKLSKRTNELAVDLASFTNFAGGAEGASAALTKALLGERESVKSLGIAILEEDVKKKVAQMRSQGMRFATMREAKAYATLEIAISQSKNAIGDYARTKMSFANVQRRVSQRNQELRESFGKILIPVATKALGIFNELQEKFISLSDTQKKWIVIVAGLVAAIAPLLIGLGLIAMALPIIAAGFALIFSPIGLIIIAITAVGAGLVWLYKKSELFRKGVNFVFDSVTDAVNRYIDYIKSVYNFIVKIVNMGKMLGGKIGGFFSGDVNVAAEGATNNTMNLEGNIGITANGATVNNASFNTPNGKLGTTVAGQGG